MTRRAFSLAELLVALGLFAVAILAILGLSISVARGSQEGEDQAVAGTVSRHLLERVVDRVRTDSPPGTAQDFWDNEHPASNPWEDDEYESNNTLYQYRVFATTVNNTLGDPVGGTTPGNRLKKIDIVINWWDSDTTERAGYGKLEFRNSRLVSEGET